MGKMWTKMMNHGISESSPRFEKNPHPAEAPILAILVCCKVAVQPWKRMFTMNFDSFLEQNMGKSSINGGFNVYY
jgi:hypothetical protein